MPTLNERAYELADAMAADAEQLYIAVRSLDCGTRVIDCGVEAAGSLEAGRRLAEVCLAGLGNVELRTAESGGPTVCEICVTTREPAAACMASQYAGWELKAEKFFAMGSGPMRAAAGREALFDAIGHREAAERCVGVLESGRLPPEEVCRDIADKCRISPARLTLLVARTASAAGTFQIVARSVETALHKLHELGFDLTLVKEGRGTAPLPPIAQDDLTAIGWTNDAILYGARVELIVTADEGTIQEFGPRVPSSASADYGQPFAEIFARCGGDFYRIDPLLFSPAVITFGDANGQRWQFGCLAPEVLRESFGSAQ